MIKFSDIPTIWKSVALVATITIGGYTYHDRFITQAQAAESDRAVIVYQVQAELRSLRLQKIQARSEELKQALQADIDALDKKLACLQDTTKTNC